MKKPQRGISWLLGLIGVVLFIPTCTKDVEDTEPPEVVITSPANGDIVSGIVVINAEVVDDSPVQKVYFFVDDSFLVEDTAAPWEHRLNTSELSGVRWADTSYHVLQASAFDQYDNQGGSEPIEIGVYLISNAPAIPNAPLGPDYGLPGEIVSFSATTTDPNEDSICFQFGWGDGSTSDWTQYVASGDTVTMQKTFDAEGTYNIQVRAKDIYEVVSPWSDQSSIYVSYYGHLKWKCDLGEPVNGSPALGYDGTIYIGTEHYLHAVNPDGTIKWSYEVDPWRVCSSPAVGPDGTIYFGCYYYYLYALNPDGTLKWRYETEWRVESSPAIGADGTIYFGTYDSSLCAVTPQGDLKWEYKVGDIVITSPTISADGKIYFGANDKYLYALTPSGKLDWKYEIGPTFIMAKSCPAIDSDGTIYFETEVGYVYAFTPSYNLKWLWAIGAPIGISPALGTDGTLYISGGRFFYSLDPEAEQVNWWYELGLWESNSPTIGSDETVYIGAVNYLYAFAPSGSQKWRYEFEGKGIGSMVIASDGTLYVGTEDGYLCAITTTSKGLASSSWPKFHHDNQNTGRVGAPLY